MDALTADYILKSPQASYWIKDALKTALKRDIVDAVNDAEILVQVLKDTMLKKFNDGRIK